jgi:AraC-like DNA-binding protein
VIECEKLSKPELIIELMNFMVTDYTQRVSEIENTEKLSPLTSAATSFIKKNISSSLDVQSLANRFYVNRKTLSSKFKTEMGKTLTKYISDERLNRAESLLIHTDKTLAEISDYLGYASQSHFQTRFKTKNNKTPTEFRRENRF